MTVVTTLVSSGKLCALDDADIILEALARAEAIDDEFRGDGITRHPWGWDTFPPPQYAQLFRFNSARDIQHRLWAYVDFSKKNTLMWTRPATAYLNAQFLTNCHTCMYRNQVSDCFELDPPSLHDYIHTLHEVGGGPNLNEEEPDG